MKSNLAKAKRFYFEIHTHTAQHGLILGREASQAGPLLTPAPAACCALFSRLIQARLPPFRENSCRKEASARTPRSAHVAQPGTWAAGTGISIVLKRRKQLEKKCQRRFLLCSPLTHLIMSFLFSNSGCLFNDKQKNFKLSRLMN